jgi:RNA polymerase sigma-70 factor (ECF subfamily)
MEQHQTCGSARVLLGLSVVLTLPSNSGISHLSNRSPRNLPDLDLIRVARGGDNSAFTELVRRYEETVFRFSYKICRDREKAAETMQDTFVNVFRKLNTFDGNSKFSTWLYTIVTNNCLMKRRKRKGEMLEESLEAFDHPTLDNRGRNRRPDPARTDETPADIVMTKELRGLLDSAITKLPKEYRIVFVMRDIEGQTSEETARALGLTVEATKSRLRRARAFLRDQLDPYVRMHARVTA